MPLLEFLLFDLLVNDYGDDAAEEPTDYDYIEDVDSDWDPHIAEEDFDND